MVPYGKTSDYSPVTIRKPKATHGIFGRFAPPSATVSGIHTLPKGQALKFL